MSKLPPLLYLGYRDIKLKRTGSLPPEEYGNWSPDKGQIAIATGKQPVEEANTVLHEVLHACLKLSADPITESEEKEERLVTVLANQLTEVWRRNPDLIAYLDARLGEEE